jgi:hypothetical protein
MNKPALSPVLATVCLATMSLGTAAAVETDLQLGPEDLRVGAEVVNKHYDQGAIRNENVTLIGHLDARWFDIGLHADWYLAANGDKTQAEKVSAGETTQINLGIDYLIEMEDVFQIIPHYQFTTYPNWSERPYKSDQHWLGVDGWYLLPWPGLEVGGGLDYNPFYNGEVDEYKARGGSGGHAFRGAIAARQFYQNAPLDIAFFQVLNFGNGEYKNFLIGDDEEGFTTLDIGVRYVAPFFLDQLWMTARLEAHFWLESDDREFLRNQDKNSTEILIGVGFEWKP